MRLVTVIIPALLFLAVFLAALTPIQDTDAWLHLSLGKLVFDQRGMPGAELYQYSMQGKPFVYSSWLFGVTTYLVYEYAGGITLSILKALLAVLAFLVIFLDSMRPKRNVLLSAFVLTGVLMMAQYRFVMRPDLLVMTFLALSVFCINAYLMDGKRYIYALPLLHMIWANTHSSITVMFVPFGAAVLGGMAEHAIGRLGLRRRVSPPSAGRLWAVFGVCAASFVFSLISPYGIGQYFHGTQFMTGDWYKQEIIELKPPTGEDLALLIGLVSAVAVSFVLNTKRFRPMDLLLVLPFQVLPFTASRFIFMAAITGGPVVVRNLSAFMGSSGNEKEESSHSLALTFLVAAWIIAFAVLGAMRVEPFGLKRMKHGLGMDVSMMPVGAVRYMDENNIKGRVLNSFRFGQYITLKGYPQRTVFIDSRGYGTEEMLESMDRFRNSNSVLDDLFNQYGFESIVIGYLSKSAENERFRAGYFSHPGWVPVYWDDVSMVFLRRGGLYEDVIRRDGYMAANPDAPLSMFASFEGGPELARTAVIELTRNINETGSVMAMMKLGLLYLSERKYEEAVNVLMRVPEGEYAGAAHLALAQCYLAMGDARAALGQFDLSLAEMESAQVLYQRGRLLMGVGSETGAQRDLERAVSLDPGLGDAYYLLIGLYEKSGQKEKARVARERLSGIKAEEGYRMLFESSMRAYTEKDYAKAADGFERLLLMRPGSPTILTNLGYAYYDMGQEEKALERFKTALGYSPDHANAHYGLGLIYFKRGEGGPAREYLKRYLELMPEGFFAREAKRMLDAS